MPSTTFAHPAPDAADAAEFEAVSAVSFTAPVAPDARTPGAPSPQPDPTCTATADRFRILTIDELPDGAMPMLIDGMLPAHCLAEIHGAPGVGKSFAVLGMALSTATGRPFLDQKATQGGVLYVAGERVRGVRRRVSAWAEHYGVVLGPDLRLRVMAEAPQLLERQNVDEFIAAIARLPFTPSLIVLDTLSRCLVGADENQAREMSKAAESLERIRRATGATVLLVHHTRKQGDVERGSTVLRGAADAMFAVKKVKGGGLALSIEKVNEMKDFPAIRLQLVPAGTSAVLTLAPAATVPEVELPASAELTAEQLGALRALRERPEGLALKQWAGYCGVSKSTLGRYCESGGVFGRHELVGRGEGSRGYVLTEKGLEVLG